MDIINMSMKEKKAINRIIITEKKLINYSVLILNQYLNFNTNFHFTDKTRDEIKKYMLSTFSNIIDEKISEELYYFENRKKKPGVNIDVFKNTKESKVCML